MFGYACDDTDDLMPMPIWLAHRLARRLTAVRKEGILDYLRPDGKTQVSIVYEDGRPKALTTVLISSQHGPGIDIDGQMRNDLIEHVIKPTIPELFAGDEYEVLVNPTGTFELGGPHADCGLTGRKIIVDTYGGMARHGGGAFSGKDPTKVDRSAAYAVRHVAKNVVAAGIATRCEVQVAYAIGVAHPVSVMVETFGTSEIDPDKLPDLVQGGLRPPARGDHRAPRPPSSDLPADRGLRALRSQRPRLHVGAHRPRRRAEEGGRVALAPRRVRGSVVRVQPDVPAIHRGVRLPARPSSRRRGAVTVGTVVRVPLHGRRVRGWVRRRRRRAARGHRPARGAGGLVGGTAGRRRRPVPVGGVALGRAPRRLPPRRVAAQPRERRRPRSRSRRRCTRATPLAGRGSTWSVPATTLVVRRAVGAGGIDAGDRSVADAVPR